MVSVIRLVQYTFAVALLVAAHGALSAQDNPLDFVDPTDRIGFDIGFSSAWQSGTYRAGCGTFDKGAALNIWMAASYDKLWKDNFRFEGLVGYQSKNVRSSYNSRENIVVNTETGQVNAEVDFENIGNASFSYLFIQPGFKFYPIPALYAGVGTSVNFLMSASTQYQKDILSKTVSLNELGVSEVFYSPSESSDPYSMVFDEQDAEGAAGVTVDGVIMVGAEFRVGKSQTNPLSTQAKKRFAISPRMQYSIPFVAALSEGENELKLGGFQLIVGLRYDL